MKWVRSVIHLFPSHLSNEHIHSAGGTVHPTVQHKLCGDTTGQSQKTLGWRYCCRKVAQTHSIRAELQLCRVTQGLTQSSCKTLQGWG